MSLTKLCQVTRSACDIMSPMIISFYNALNSDIIKAKSDNSVFTIADGVVQVRHQTNLSFIELKLHLNITEFSSICSKITCLMVTSFVPLLVSSSSTDILLK